MTSTIKVDTISENTSANGVAVDGVTLKDGGGTFTSPVLVPDGSTSAVSLGNDGDPNTGIYFQAADSLGLVLGGSRKLSASSTGVVIENGTLSAKGGAVFNEDSADVDFRVESNGNANTLFVNGGTDRVAVGTNAPAQTMHIRSTGNPSNDTGLILEGNATDSNCTLYFYNSAGTEKGRFLYDTDDNFLQTKVNGSEVMRIKSDGNVGIGTTNPNHKLNVSGGNINLDDDSGLYWGGNANNRIFGSLGSHYLRFYTGGAEGLRISQYAKLSTNGESASDTGEGGLCLNGAANDDFAMTFKNSDVSHGITSVAQADTYGALVKANSSNGGLGVYGFADAGTTALELQAYFETNNTSKASNCNVPVKIVTRLRNGTSSTAPSNGSANSNLFGVADGTSTRFIVDSEGDIHVDGSSSLSTYDEYEDAHLVRAYDLSHGKGVIDSKFDKFISYNHEKLAEMKLVGREDDGTPNHFINMTGMQRLHNGAIWQQYEKYQKLASAFYKLAEKTIGKEEADKLLTEEEIQLLN